MRFYLRCSKCLKKSLTLLFAILKQSFRMLFILFLFLLMEQAMVLQFVLLFVCFVMLNTRTATHNRTLTSSSFIIIVIIINNNSNNVITSLERNVCFCCCHCWCCKNSYKFCCFLAIAASLVRKKRYMHIN